MRRSKPFLYGLTIAAAPFLPPLQGDKKLMEHLGKLGADVLSSTGSTGTVVVIQV